MLDRLTRTESSFHFTGRGTARRKILNGRHRAVIANRLGSEAMTSLFAPHVLLWLALPAVIFVVAVAVRKLRTGEQGDFVAPNVLVRINADYPERH
jgi:hypothetical protein